MHTQDFTYRSRLDELMDTVPVSFEDFRSCLVDLAAVNRMTLAYRPTLAFLERVLAAGWPRQVPLRILDVGSGYGDTLRRVSAWAASRGVAVELTGIDLNPWARRAAEEASAPSQRIQWVTADALAYAPRGRIDVIVSSLFTHHLPDEQLVRFLMYMEEHAQVAWFVNDLHRHPLPYAFFRAWSRLARFHRFVQHDGPVSIARAFTRADWRRFLREAGIDVEYVEVAWRVPFRITVARFR